MPPAPPDIRDIKPLVALPANWPELAIAAGAILAVLLAAAATWWWRRRRAAKPDASAAPADPPDMVALRALGALAAALAEDGSMIQVYCFGVSEVLRVYVEGRFALNATDLTTLEIRTHLESLRESLRVPRDALLLAASPELIAILDQADAVKFARAPATLADCHEMHRRACAFVSATARPVPALSPEAAPASSPAAPPHATSSSAPPGLSSTAPSDSPSGADPAPARSVSTP